MAIHALRTLGDTPLPPTLVDDLACAKKLPEQAVRHIWDALGPVLGEPVPHDVEQRLDAYAARHEVGRDELAQTLRGARFLVREAAKRNATQEDFAGDVAQILGEDAEATRVIVAGYARARDVVRRQGALRVLDEHGRVVESLVWRVDKVEAASSGAQAGERVAIVTMRTRERGEATTLTLQLPAHFASELEALSAVLAPKRV